MLINRKIIIMLGLLSGVTFVSLTSMQQPEEDKKAVNLKVLPKNLTDKQLDGVMDEWSHSLGVRCGFCHARNEQTQKMDWASDAKPEKNIARQMYTMTAGLNKKYFEAKKDSLGMILEAGVNCYTCHNGQAHPEVKTPPAPPHRQGAPLPPGVPDSQSPPPGGQAPQGTPPPSGGK